MRRIPRDDDAGMEEDTGDGQRGRRCRVAGGRNSTYEGAAGKRVRKRSKGRKEILAKGKGRERKEKNYWEQKRSAQTDQGKKRRFLRRKDIIRSSGARRLKRIGKTGEPK